MVPIEKEISFLMNYVELQKLNQKDKYTFEVNVATEIDAESTYITAMIIQPLIENAIEHGFRDLKTGGKIKVEFSLYAGE